MANRQQLMPKMGESVSEATIITWSKNIGDIVELDEDELSDEIEHDDEE